MTRRTFSFHLDEKKNAFLIKKLDALLNKNDLFIMLLKDHFDINKERQTKIDEAMKQEKLTLLKMDKSLKAKKIAESHSKARLNDAQRIYIEKNIRTPPARPRLENYNQAQYELIDAENSRIHCKYCDTFFQFDPSSSNDKVEAKENFFNHAYKKHGIELSQKEIEILTAL